MYVYKCLMLVKLYNYALHTQCAQTMRYEQM